MTQPRLQRTTRGMLSTSREPSLEPSLTHIYIYIIYVLWYIFTGRYLLDASELLRGMLIITAGEHDLSAPEFGLQTHLKGHAVVSLALPGVPIAGWDAPAVSRLQQAAASASETPVSSPWLVWFHGATDCMDEAFDLEIYMHSVLALLQSIEQALGCTQLRVLIVAPTGCSME